jgi:hypothetical protein
VASRRASEAELASTFIPITHRVFGFAGARSPTTGALGIGIYSGITELASLVVSPASAPGTIPTFPTTVALDILATDGPLGGIAVGAHAGGFDTVVRTGAGVVSWQHVSPDGTAGTAVRVPGDGVPAAARLDSSRGAFVRAQAGALAMQRVGCR